MRFGLMIARQRSGTGALGSVLDKHPQLKYLGEVLHPDNVGSPDNYFTHLLERVRESPLAALPDQNEANLSTFVEKRRQAFPGRTPVLDIKYRSLHHFDGGWKGLVEKPWILAYCISNGLPVLHLTRRNFVEAFVSGRLADANKTWHARSLVEIRLKSITVNIRSLCAYMADCQEEARLVEEWLSTYPRLLSIDYSELFDEEGYLSPALATRLSQLFGIDAFNNRSPSFIKQAPPRLRDAIDNFDLVREALAGTPHAWMVAG